MENFIIATLSFLLVILIMVFIHEWGHFYVARLCGVKVDTFAIGFGKTIWSKFDSKGTEWKINILPFGGYVKMFGDLGPASSPDDEKIQSMSQEEKNVSFFHKPLWQKALIVFAGPLMNYLLAFVVMVVIVATYGEKTFSNKIAALEENGPAAEAGIIVGDIIDKVNGQKVYNMIQVKEIIGKSREDHQVAVKIVRDGNELNFELQPKKTLLKSGEVTYRIGVVPSEETIYYSLTDAIANGYNKIILLNGLIIDGLISLVTGNSSIDELGGPIKIAQISGEAAKHGIESFLTLLVLLSLNLGLMNLLPIPGLDGGHLMYYSINAIFGRPLSIKIQEMGIKIGFILLIGLLIFVTYNDIFNLLK
jgi:regulator of sigma E protease